MIETDPTNNMLSGVELGEINYEKLKDYLAELRASGQELPMQNGKPNRTAIAEAAGLRRNVLYTNKKAIALLNKFIGSDEEASIPDHQLVTISQDQAKIQSLEQRILVLEQKLAAVSAENEELRKQIEQYRVIEEVIKAGRRVIP